MYSYLITIRYDLGIITYKNSTADSNVQQKLTFAALKYIKT